MTNRPKHILMFYDLLFLGSGPGFDEIAHYLSFEQLIHYAFDGIFCKGDAEQVAQWGEMVNDTILDAIVAAHPREPTYNDELLATGIESLLVNYFEWLAPYVLVRVTSSDFCVQLVTIIGNDVYVHCTDMEIYDESTCRLSEACTHYPTVLRL